jgi:hypothetical protein
VLLMTPDVLLHTLSHGVFRVRLCIFGVTYVMLLCSKGMVAGVGVLL